MQRCLDRAFQLIKLVMHRELCTAPITGKPDALKRTSQQVQAGGDVAEQAPANFQLLLALQDLA